MSKVRIMIDGPSSLDSLLNQVASTLEIGMEDTDSIIERQFTEIGSGPVGKFTPEVIEAERTYAWHNITHAIYGSLFNDKLLTEALPFSDEDARVDSQTTTLKDLKTCIGHTYKFLERLHDEAEGELASSVKATSITLLTAMEQIENYERKHHNGVYARRAGYMREGYETPHMMRATTTPYNFKQMSAYLLHKLGIDSPGGNTLADNIGSALEHIKTQVEQSTSLSDADRRSLLSETEVKIGFWESLQSTIRNASSFDVAHLVDKYKNGSEFKQTYAEMDNETRARAFKDAQLNVLRRYDAALDVINRFFVRCEDEGLVAADAYDDQMIVECNAMEDILGQYMLARHNIRSKKFRSGPLDEQIEAGHKARMEARALARRATSTAGQGGRE